MKRRHFILLLGGASSGALSVGSGAFSSVEAERGVDVNVVEDKKAYLSLKQNKTEEQNKIEIPANQKQEVVEIGNKFPDPLDLAVTVEESGEGIDAVSIDDDGDIKDLTPGEFVSVSATCSDDGSFKLGFDGTAGGASVDATRVFEIKCVNSVDDVEFQGQSGNVKVSGNFSGLTVTKEFESGDPEDETISSDQGGKAILNSGNNTIVAVTIDGTRYERSSASS